MKTTLAYHIRTKEMQQNLREQHILLPRLRPIRKLEVPHSGENWHITVRAMGGSWQSRLWQSALRRRLKRGFDNGKSGICPPEWASSEQHCRGCDQQSAALNSRPSHRSIYIYFSLQYQPILPTLSLQVSWYSTRSRSSYSGRLFD